MKRHWIYSPHSGGRKVSPLVQEKTRNRILTLNKRIHGSVHHISLQKT